MATVGDVTLAMAGLGESVPVTVNGQHTIGVQAVRVGEEMTLDFQLPPTELVPPSAEALAAAEREQETQPEERRQNDPAELTEEERRDLALFEELGDVEDQRRAEASSDSAAAGGDDLGDHGSERDPL